MNDRDKLRQELWDRQNGLCAACGRGAYDDFAIHEAGIKRGDLPKDKRIFVPINCVGVHNSHPACTMPHMIYGNTRKYDRICMAYLFAVYGEKAFAEWAISLNMREYPARVSGVVKQYRD